MKLSLSKAVVVSLLIHGILLSLLAYFSTVSVQLKPEKKPVIQARLFFPPKPKSIPVPIVKPADKPDLESVELKVEVEQPKQREAELKAQDNPEQKSQNQSEEKTLKTVANKDESLAEKVESRVEKTKNPVRGRFNPYKSIDKMMDTQTEDYVNSIDIGLMLKKAEAARIKSINSSDDPNIKEIFKSEIIIDAQTRVVSCRELQRHLCADKASA